jgi:hypothetical protein
MVLVYRDVNVSDPESGVARTLPALTICATPASKLLDPRICELVSAGLLLQSHCGLPVKGDPLLPKKLQMALRFRACDRERMCVCNAACSTDACRELPDPDVLLVQLRYMEKISRVPVVR